METRSVCAGARSKTRVRLSALACISINIIGPFIIPGLGQRPHQHCTRDGHMHALHTYVWMCGAGVRSDDVMSNRISMRILSSDSIAHRNIVTRGQHSPLPVRRCRSAVAAAPAAAVRPTSNHDGVRKVNEKRCASLACVCVHIACKRCSDAITRQSDTPAQRSHFVRSRLRHCHHVM